MSANLHDDVSIAEMIATVRRCWQREVDQHGVQNQTREAVVLHEVLAMLYVKADRD